MSQLLISQQYLKDKSIIQDNTDFKLLTSVILWVQELKLKRLLGTNLYNLILTQSTPPTSLTAANTTLLNSYILNYLLFYVQSESIMTLKYRLTNIGVVSRDASNQGFTGISSTESQNLMDFYKNKAEEYGQEMVDYIKANASLYPTYFTNTGLGDIIPNPDAYDIQIYLPPLNKVDDSNDAGDFRYE